MIILLSGILVHSSPRLEAVYFNGRSKVKVAAVCAVGLAAIVGLGVASYLPQKRINALPAGPIKVVNGSRIPQLPTNFEIFENVFSFTDTFTIHDDAYQYGLLEEKFLTLTKSFDFVSTDGVTIATARQKFLSWGVEIQVFNESGQLIGEIHEKVMESLFKPFTTYEIYDRHGQLVAESKKADWISTEFTVQDLRGNSVLYMERPWMNFPADKWLVTMSENPKLDPRLTLMIAAYKSSVDNDRRSESSSSSSSKK